MSAKNLTIDLSHRYKSDSLTENLGMMLQRSQSILELLSSQFEHGDSDISHIVIYCALDAAIQELNDAHALIFAHSQAKKKKVSS